MSVSHVDTGVCVCVYMCVMLTHTFNTIHQAVYLFILIYASSSSTLDYELWVVVCNENIFSRSMPLLTNFIFK